MPLPEDFVSFAEQVYDVDWLPMQERIASRLPSLKPLGSSLCDPLVHPTYWCLPILLGNYVGASKHAVLADTEEFVAACLIRHHAFEEGPALANSALGSYHRIIDRAYEQSHMAFSDRYENQIRKKFARKCAPWLAAMALGVRAIKRERGDHPSYTHAVHAITATYSCMQVIDDWNDRAEDAARAQWNMWVNAPLNDVLPLLAPLLEAADERIGLLATHLLKRALEAQMHDSRVEIARILEEAESSAALRGA